jgi:hypothetical protein
MGVATHYEHGRARQHGNERRLIGLYQETDFEVGVMAFCGRWDLIARCNT